MSAKDVKIMGVLMRAERWLTTCGIHDAGLAMTCTCPDGDPRAMILDLVTIIEELQGGSAEA